MKFAKAIFGVLLILPLGIKTNLANIDVGLSRMRLLLDLEQNTLTTSYGIESVNRGTLTLYHPDGSQSQARLTGLAPSSARWQNEATGVLAIVLRASQGRVAIEQTAPGLVVAKLSNGTMLQRILLSSGVAKTDPEQLARLPVAEAALLRSAEFSAQQQNKNIWVTE